MESRETICVGLSQLKRMSADGRVNWVNKVSVNDGLQVQGRIKV